MVSRALLWKTEKFFWEFQDPLSAASISECLLYGTLISQRTSHEVGSCSSKVKEISFTWQFAKQSSIPTALVNPVVGLLNFLNLLNLV